MAKAKVTIRVKETGRTGRAAINEFSGIGRNIPNKVRAGIPAFVYPSVANMVRRNFVDNYANQENWNDPYFTSRQYEQRKNRWMANGDQFRIGTFGLRPVIHGSEIFGRRTDTIFNAIGSRTGSYVHTTMRQYGSDFATAVITVGLNAAAWEGGQSFIPTSEKAHPYKMTTRNQLEAFSYRVTKPGSDSSVFVQQTLEQRNRIAMFIEKSVMGGIAKSIFRYGPNV